MFMHVGVYPPIPVCLTWENQITLIEANCKENKKDFLGCD